MQNPYISNAYTYIKINNNNFFYMLINFDIEYRSRSVRRICSGECRIKEPNPKEEIYKTRTIEIGKEEFNLEKMKVYK